MSELQENNLNAKNQMLLQQLQMQNGGPVAPDGKVVIQVQLPQQHTSGQVAAQQQQQASQEEQKNVSSAARGIEIVNMEDVSLSDHKQSFLQENKNGKLEVAA